MWSVIYLHYIVRSQLESARSVEPAHAGSQESWELNILRGTFRNPALKCESFIL